MSKKKDFILNIYGSLSVVWLSRIQSSKVRRRNLSMYGKRRELIDA